MSKEVKHMKILLVVPQDKGILQITPPLGLGYLATSLRKNSFSDVEILDCSMRKYGFSQFTRFIKAYKPNIIGFQVWLRNIPIVQKYIEIIKEIKLKCWIIIGGFHPSSDPQNVLNYIDADYAFRGEAEIGFPLLVKCIEKNILSSEQLKKIPGLIWRNNKEIVVNEQIFVEDLDSLEFPAWDLMPPDKYPSTSLGYFSRTGNIGHISATRGCPHYCIFCSAWRVNGRKIRTRSVRHIISEIEFLKNNYGIKEIHFVDDNITANRAFVVSLCKTLIEKNLGIIFRFANSIRLDTVDAELLDLMKRAGNYRISLGVESGSQRVLNYIKKGTTIKMIREKVRLMRKHGFEVVGSFMFGFPTETEKEINQTIKFSKELDLKMIGFNSMIPLPGTEVYEYLKKEGELKENVDYQKFSFYNINYVPKGLTAKKMKQLQRKGYLSFYLRPKSFLRLISSIRIGQITTIIRAMIKWLFD